MDSNDLLNLVPPVGIVPIMAAVRPTGGARQDRLDRALARSRLSGSRQTTDEIRAAWQRRQQIAC